MVCPESSPTNWQLSSYFLFLSSCDAPLVSILPPCSCQRPRPHLCFVPIAAYHLKDYAPEFIYLPSLLIFPAVHSCVLIPSNYQHVSFLDSVSSASYRAVLGSPFSAKLLEKVVATFSLPLLSSTQFHWASILRTPTNAALALWSHVTPTLPNSVVAPLFSPL